MANELNSGDTLTMTNLAKRRDDVHDVIVQGGYVYLSRNGRRKMALVPAHVAEAHYEHGNVDEDSESSEDVNTDEE